MRVRIPIAQGDDGEATTQAGEYAFVIIDTEQITHIRREAESREPPGVRMSREPRADVLYTETTIRMVCGTEIVFKDDDLCAGWTHDTLLEAIDCHSGDYSTEWNPPETVPKKARKSQKSKPRT